MVAAIKPRVREDLVVADFDDEAVVYDPDTHHLHLMNAPARLVLALFDGTATIKQTATEIAEEFGQSPREVERQVRGMLRLFKSRQLLAAEKPPDGTGPAPPDHDHDHRERIRAEVPRND